jgi:hypothetical protein
LTAEEGGEVLKKIPQTETLEERAETAQVCTATLKLSLPTVVDKDDNQVNANYAGWPDRFVIVGLDGKVAFMGKPGPSGFKPPEVQAWLEANVDGAIEAPASDSASGGR